MIEVTGVLFDKPCLSRNTTFERHWQSQTRPWCYASWKTHHEWNCILMASQRVGAYGAFATHHERLSACCSLFVAFRFLFWLEMINPSFMTIESKTIYWNCLVEGRFPQCVNWKHLWEKWGYSRLNTFSPKSSKNSTNPKQRFTFDGTKPWKIP